MQDRKLLSYLIASLLPSCPKSSQSPRLSTIPFWFLPFPLHPQGSYLDGPKVNYYISLLSFSVLSASIQASWHFFSPSSPLFLSRSYWELCKPHFLRKTFPNWLSLAWAILFWASLVLNICSIHLAVSYALCCEMALVAWITIVSWNMI